MFPDVLICICSDCMDFNIMMDGDTMFPDGYYPIPTDHDMRPGFTGRAKCFTRTERPPKYYFIGFGITRRDNIKGGSPPELPVLDGRTVPEFQRSNKARNPFPANIYYLGDVIKELFLEVSRQGRSPYIVFTVDAPRILASLGI